jgi:hypothetical protein
MSRVPIVFKKLNKVTRTRHATNASGIADRDANRLQVAKAWKYKTPPRVIDMSKIEEYSTTLRCYPISDKTRTADRAVILCEDMPKVLGVDRNVFDRWRVANKIPPPSLRVRTGSRGYPPKAYHVDEIRGILTVLVSHYRQFRQYSSYHVATRRAIEAIVEVTRKKLDIN